MKNVYSSADNLYDELAFAIDAAELGIWDLNPLTNSVKVNARLRDWFGLAPEGELPLSLILESIADADRERVTREIWQSMQPDSDGRYDVVYAIVHPQTGRRRIVHAKGKVQFDSNRVATRLNGIVQDITETKQAEEALKASETKLRSIVETAPVSIGLYVGRDLIIELPNQAFIDIMGKGADIIGKPLRDVMPELISENQPFLQILDDVYTSGKPFHSYDSLVQIMQQGVMTHNYYNFTYTPLFNEAGDVYAILEIAIDVTGAVRDRQAIEENEARFRSLIQEAPVATSLYMGRNLIVEVANDIMLGYWGKERSILGLPLTSALPELEGQPFIQLLNDIFDTGQVYEERAAPADLVVNGTLSRFYFDYTYKPLFDAAGQVYAIMNMAIDVTEAVLARRQIEETQATLRGAIELAQLAVWELDINQQLLKHSPRYMEWLGSTGHILTVEQGYSFLPHEHRSAVISATEASWEPGGTGMYDCEHPIINHQTGQVRIIHAQAQVRYDDDGKPAFLSGTAQDVTEQRRIRQELERQVAERTQQLQSSIHDLERSNINLQQFAYVASHDLQEPLRKIRSFGNLLAEQYGDRLGEGIDLLNRMQAASSRMSVLIQDLLTFSRISTRQETTSSVELTTVVEEALVDLELRIQETGATFTVGSLPTIQGDASQLGQLFQNLFNNALKFSQPGVPPHIQVRAHTIATEQVPPLVRPTRSAETYYRIDVSDNGIGFEEKYIDRIFQVFQRLHGKTHYAGTGIGLAICEKVAANHGGAITATSQPNQGATFSVYLPVETVA